MLAVVSLKRSLDFDPIEQGQKRKRCEKFGSSSPPIVATSTPFSLNTMNNSNNSNEFNGAKVLSNSNVSQQNIMSKIFSSSRFPSSPIDQHEQQRKKISTNINNTSNSFSSITPFSTNATQADDLSIFTIRQTATMITRMLNDNEKLLKEQYEKLLNIKLNEQYDQFVRFTHDEVDKQHSSRQEQLQTFSYVS
ncbi:unnamed protein product [Didymodactylos carnosus]|uniref:Akirin n=1 Tax=Didymodactylos carnosus TaxID=1234261 RepID=A0A813PLG8_9BILA|nr:unnamed protein product [Didymodactylos carnosus]CAF0754600.1 unnamed protein product [Didymodactylos carnosus]CAF3511614.1 unnamed protein product [Didymodactylos carnosus]CAF3534796.1 unnamed protein product [Didymodactylos carnosus]